jgi:RNA polymerase sigma-70 factor (ECF subfamily)
MEQVATLSDRLANGDQQALVEFIALNRGRLEVAVMLRMDPRVRGRIDPGDVLQEVFIEASKRLHEYGTHLGLDAYVWLRTLTLQRLLILHRRHLEAQVRDARRDVSLNEILALDVSSIVMAAQLISSGTSPSGIVTRAEEAEQLHRALNQLEPLDREVMAMRHFEQLNNSETAAVLDLTESAASQRYYRALKRLKGILELPSNPNGSTPSQ